MFRRPKLYNAGTPASTSRRLVLALPSKLRQEGAGGPCAGIASGHSKRIASGVRENSLNRVLKLARHVSRFGVDETTHQLYEPHLLWMNEDRFVLTVFERVGEGANAADYTQSWLCMLGVE